MRPIIVKCVERHTVDTVNGPLTTIKLVHDGSRADKGISICIHDEEDLAAYQVGKRFLFTPKALP